MAPAALAADLGDHGRIPAAGQLLLAAAHQVVAGVVRQDHGRGEQTAVLLMGLAGWPAEDVGRQIEHLAVRHAEGLRQLQCLLDEPGDALLQVGGVTVGDLVEPVPAACLKIARRRGVDRRTHERDPRLAVGLVLAHQLTRPVGLRVGGLGVDQQPGVVLARLDVPHAQLEREAIQRIEHRLGRGDGHDGREVHVAAWIAFEGHAGLLRMRL
ncbi:hypothetical protein ACFQWF_01500 [Methylorubrum suomiense]